MPIPRLTDEMVIELLDDERKTYSTTYVPLHQTKINSIEKCCKLILQAEEIRYNVPKKRARIILKDLWTSAPDIFVLCASTIPLNRLGSNSSTSYLGKILSWWEGVHHPGGLTETVGELDALKSLVDHFGKTNQQTTSTDDTTPLEDQSTPTTNCEGTPGNHQERHISESLYPTEQQSLLWMKECGNPDYPGNGKPPNHISIVNLQKLRPSKHNQSSTSSPTALVHIR